MPANLKVTEVIEKYMALAYFDHNMERNLDARSYDGDTILHKAIFHKNLHDVILLLEAGADICAVGDMSYTPLHEAVEFGSSEIVIALVEAGASVSALSEFGETPLDIAKRLKKDTIYRVLTRAVR